MVRTGRVELPFPFGSQILSLVRLPIPPRSHYSVIISQQRCTGQNMRILPPATSPAVWRGFWIGAILALLGLASAFTKPVIGVLQGAIFLAVA